MNFFSFCSHILPLVAVILLNCEAFAESTNNAVLDTSKVPGVVIDHSPKLSGKYIGSPSIAILPNGDYVASHDFFGPRANHRTNATSVVFSSADKGKSWRKIATITPLFWGKLFVHKDALYILGTRHEYGDMLIRRSTDNGKTWTEPSDAANGLLRKGTFHCAPCQTLLHNNRIWRSMEVFTGGPWGNFEAMVISAPVDADLLNADTWTCSERLPKNQGFSWLEGAVLLAPDNTIVNMLRTNGSGDDKAAIVHVAEDGKTLSFNPATDVIDMPGGGVKFTIRYDKATSRYWAIVNKQTNPKAFRNNLLLVSSTDLKAWRTEATLQNHADSSVHAWQYIDWQFEGNDIIYLSRTAFDDGLGGAHRAHDANFLTFHRIANFRNYGTPPPYVKCIGTFIAYDADYPWFENFVEKDGTDVHSDGSSPRATFRISAPTTYNDRKVAILFKYTGADLPLHPSSDQIGKTFSLDVPEDFFTEKFGTIDNIHIRNLKKTVKTD